MPVSNLTIRELLEIAKQDHPEAGSFSRHELADRVEKVLALHSKQRNNVYGGIDYCPECTQLLGHGRLKAWPCATIRALEEEQ